MQTRLPLIQLENIEKVFLTDEVETHALSGVTSKSGTATTCPSPDLREGVNPHCSRFWACLIRHPAAVINCAARWSSTSIMAAVRGCGIARLDSFSKALTSSVT